MVAVGGATPITHGLDSLFFSVYGKGLVPQAVSSRNLYCCAVLAGLPSRHKLSYYAGASGQI